MELRRVLHPAKRCLEDAFALAKTEDLEPRVAASVVPGFCREAVEAVLTDRVRRKRLVKGERHADVEELLEQCTTLRKLAALALCDDSSRVTEANALIARQGSAEIFRLLNQGAHEKGLDGDLLAFVRRTEDLVPGSARMRPADALGAARRLVTRDDPGTAGVWPRAAALLARQALERAMADLYRKKAPGMERCQGRPQLLCLRRFLPHPVAQRAQYTWHVLSQGCHHHAYELPPDSRELLAALDSVGGLLESIEEALQPRD